MSRFIVKLPIPKEQPYVLRPGFVFSDDGERHFVGPARLAIAYGIRPRLCRIQRDTPEDKLLGDKPGIHLFPLPDGEYLPPPPPSAFTTTAFLGDTPDALDQTDPLEDHGHSEQGRD